MPAKDLNPQQADLLSRLLSESKGISAEKLDGRTVRALKSRNLAVQRDGRIVVTDHARTTYLSQAPRPEQESRRAPHIPMSSVQQDMLRSLVRSTEPIPEDQLDRRTAKALIGRGLARWVNGGLEAIDAAREGGRENGSGRRKRRGQDPRAQVILKAVEDLERAVPRDSELAVGRMFCHIDDLLDGFRRMAARRNGRRH